MNRKRGWDAIQSSSKIIVYSKYVSLCEGLHIAENMFSECSLSIGRDSIPVRGMGTFIYSMA